MLRCGRADGESSRPQDEEFNHHGKTYKLFFGFIQWNYENTAADSLKTVTWELEFHVQSLSHGRQPGPVKFAGHVRQAVAPMVPRLYLPAWHGTHDEEPLTSLYVPAPQAMHLWAVRFAFGPVYPALQMHADASLLASRALECGGHAWQTDEALPAVETEYVLEGHGVQGASPMKSLK